MRTAVTNRALAEAVAPLTAWLRVTLVNGCLVGGCAALFSNTLLAQYSRVILTQADGAALLFTDTGGTCFGILTVKTAVNVTPRTAAPAGGTDRISVIQAAFTGGATAEGWHALAVGIRQQSGRSLSGILGYLGEDES